MPRLTAIGNIPNREKTYFKNLHGQLTVTIAQVVSYFTVQTWSYTLPGWLVLLAWSVLTGMVWFTWPGRDFIWSVALPGPTLYLAVALPGL